jgi:hypothetical protein
MIQPNIKEAYCIFQQPWWLEALAPSQWTEAQVIKDGEIIARLPYLISNRYGLKSLAMPPLTPFVGPWLKDSTAKYSKQLSQQKDLMTELIQQLPRHDYFSQGFHYSITNYLPFFWHQFDGTPYYSYLIEQLDDLDKIWKELQENIRREIRKAEKILSVNTNPDIDKFLDIHELSYKRQGLSLPYSRELVMSLDEACAAHQQRKIFFAEDAQGRPHAAIYLVWDDNSAYYLMGGGNPELRNSGAHSLIMWEAIKFAATVTKQFDFEGSMVESIERFFRGFGAKQKSYFYLKRISSRRMKLLSSARDLIRSFR